MIRIANVIGGHVHPAACVTHSGKILVVYNKEGGGGKELLLVYSNDGGLTWSYPASIPSIQNCSIYPGSLTTLSNGTILLNWSCYRKTRETLWREPQFTFSYDEGETWSDPKNYPITDHTNYTCLRHAVVERSVSEWVCSFYDRTVLYDNQSNQIKPFGDGRNHGMVPIICTNNGILISGAPQANAPVPVGVPGEIVGGLRSTDEGLTWTAMNVFPYFGVAGYDLTALTNNWVVLTYIVYGIGHDGEFSYNLTVSHDEGITWHFGNTSEVYNPRRRIIGRGWPRTVQLDDKTLGTIFYDLDQEQPGGPGIFIVHVPLNEC
ncbi:TPA: hypothetical protein DHW51_06785 [Candidatus Poribacteria bacterium]|nr:hypothetical protein [Candidatus Poribacteria bacterium]HCK13808.1 hypothetical protein [Candidatus Poribacteria bacterium]|tara:strand:+ start:1575 stop:2534 length:960 start_codon:yes stop_codon:yes gene_type:complete